MPKRERQDFAWLKAAFLQSFEYFGWLAEYKNEKNKKCQAVYNFGNILGVKKLLPIAINAAKRQAKSCLSLLGLDKLVFSFDE